MPIELDLSHTSAAKLRVVGVGGAGGNAVSTMISRGLQHVEFIAANTDSQALMKNPASIKITLGNETTRGLGAGANPDVGRAAIEESLEEVRGALEGSDMVFITAGMGGGTGTGAAPVVARIAREIGALVVAIVTKPFSFENIGRMTIAERGINELREHVDALIVIPNDRILNVVEASVPYRQALERVDEVLLNATKGIADIINHSGIINVDFADVVTVMRNQGDAMMGIGTGTGERRAIEAAQNALNSPMLEGMSIYGAKGLLVNITCDSSLTLHEVHEAVSCVQKAAGEEAHLIHGVVEDNTLDGEMYVTVVATGFAKTSDNASTVQSEIPSKQSAPSAITKSATFQPAPAPSAARSEQLSLEPQGRVDAADIEVPAVWRKKDRRPLAENSGTHVPLNDSANVYSDTASREAERQGPLTPERVSPRQPEPLPTPQQPDAFPRVRVKAAAGKGGNSPAFLRKIMD